MPEVTPRPDGDKSVHHGREYPHITTTYGGSGFFAVQLWWNPDLGGFAEPWQTGIGRYKTSEEAEKEGRMWAAAEEMPFYA